MAKVVDLSKLLDGGNPKVVLKGKSYEINIGLKSVLLLDDLASKREKMKQSEFLKEFLNIAFGKEPTKELLDADYPMKVYLGLIEAVKEALDEESIVSQDSKNA